MLTTIVVVRVLKNILPIVVLLVLSFYTYVNNTWVSTTFIDSVVYLPAVLALLVAFLSIHFNRSSVFFYVLLVLISYFVLKLDWLDTELRYNMFSGFMPLLVLVFSALPERSILSPRAMPAYSILLVIIALVVWGVIKSPDWLVYFMLGEWLPSRYFDWTLLSQTVLACSVLAFLAMLILSFVRPSTHMAAGLGTLLMLVAQMHYFQDVRSLVVYSSAALLMCLYAVVQESWRMAYLDELTELPARRALREKFQSMKGQHAIAMLDVDHFKKFNDTYGHDTGDDVLRMIAAKLRKVTGDGAPFRYGGEEFAVVFTGRTSDDVKSHLDALRKDIADSRFVVNRQDRRSGSRDPGNKEKNTVQVTVSIGFSVSSDRSASPWDTLKLADKALYRAKKKGRNCVLRQFGDQAL